MVGFLGVFNFVICGLWVEGKYVWMEDLGFFFICMVLGLVGMMVVGVLVDEEGFDIDVGK